MQLLAWEIAMITKKVFDGGVVSAYVFSFGHNY